MKIEKHIKGPLTGQVNVRQTLAGMSEGDEWKVRRSGANVDSLRTEAARVAAVTGACFSVFAPIGENWIKVIRTR